MHHFAKLRLVQFVDLTIERAKSVVCCRTVVVSVLIYLGTPVGQANVAAP